MNGSRPITRGFFISAIGTNCGKTVVSAVLARALQAVYFKPVQAGTDPMTDRQQVLKLMGRFIPPPEQEVYVLKTPMSPDEAAQRDGVEIELGRIHYPQTEHPLIVEGAGGLLVPLNQEHTIADLVVHSGLPLILVVQDYLGSINHTLLSLECIRARKLPFAGIIYTGKATPSSRKSIARLTGAPVLLEIPEFGPAIEQELPLWAQEHASEIRRILSPWLEFKGASPSANGSALVNDPEEKDWIQAAQNQVWPPYTHLKDASPARIIQRAQGALLFPLNGEPIIDGISSWWVTNHGHGHPKVVQAVQKQAEELDHSIFTGLSHKPGIELARALLDAFPHPLSRVFYSDNGSTAVEVALKMALQVASDTGKRKVRILAQEGAYHGDTFGAMALSARGQFAQAFEQYLIRVDFIPPELLNGSGSEDPQSWLRAQGIRDEALIFIYEPLIQGAAGMRLLDPGIQNLWLRTLRQAHAFLIADEVFTGFGRTGTLFASEVLETAPDLVCLSKGLTAGLMPMGATLAGPRIQEYFMGEHTFYHGHSYTGNPMGCRAGLAGLQLFSEMGTWESIQGLSRAQARFVQKNSGHKNVRGMASRGTLLRMDLVPGNKEGHQGEEQEGYWAPIRHKVFPWFLERGVFLRPLGNVLYFLPPYSITGTQVQQVHEAIEEFLDQI